MTAKSVATVTASFWSEHKVEVTDPEFLRLLEKELNHFRLTLRCNCNLTALCVEMRQDGEVKR